MDCSQRLNIKRPLRFHSRLADVRNVVREFNETLYYIGSVEILGLA